MVRPGSRPSPCDPCAKRGCPNLNKICKNTRLQYVARLSTRGHGPKPRPMPGRGARPKASGQPAAPSDRKYRSCCESGAQSRNRTSDTRIFKPSTGAGNQPVARRFPVKPPTGNQALGGRLSNRFSGDPGQRKTVEGAATHLDGAFEVTVLTRYQNPDSGAITGGLHV